MFVEIIKPFFGEGFPFYIDSVDDSDGEDTLKCVAFLRNLIDEVLSKSGWITIPMVVSDEITS